MSGRKKKRTKKAAKPPPLSAAELEPMLSARHDDSHSQAPTAAARESATSTTTTSEGDTDTQTSESGSESPSQTTDSEDESQSQTSETETTDESLSSDTDADADADARAPAPAAPKPEPLRARAPSRRSARRAELQSKTNKALQRNRLRADGAVSPRRGLAARRRRDNLLADEGEVDAADAAEAAAAAPTDVYRRTALHVAAAEGDLPAIVRLLDDDGADVNAEDRFKRRPLDDALVNGDLQILKLLRTRGAELGHDGPIDYTQKMIYAATRNDCDMIRLLDAAGVDVNAPDYDGRTPLHLAVVNVAYDAVKLLVERGADLYKEDRWCVTPLKEAKNLESRVGDSPIWRFLAGHLRAQGVDVGQRYVQSFWVMYGLLWMLMILLLIFFGRYGRDAGGRPELPVEPHLGRPAGVSDAEVAAPVPNTAERINTFAHMYPSFQDVHVMIFIGFGLLMSFLRKASYTAIGFTFLIAAFTIVLYQFWRSLWRCVLGGECVGVVLDLEAILLGDFCAAAVLIAFGVVIGRVSANQMLFCAVLLSLFYSLNEAIALYVLPDTVTDIGGTVLIHQFGAYFGLAFSLAVLPREGTLDGRENNTSVYHSDMFAMVGTVFLWLFWPSFNSAPAAPGIAMNRTVTNTVLSLCGSCVAAFLSSYALRREGGFNIVDVQNATLAGGVAIGAAANLPLLPGVALLVGTVAGFLSVCGYVFVQPFLEQRLRLLDTCGVHNLHGMPALLGAVVGAVVVGQLPDSVSGVDFTPGGAGVRAQFVYTFVTLGISLVGGLVTGKLCAQPLCQPLRDDVIFSDTSAWSTPSAETPFFHDTRGEIARGLANEVVQVEHEAIQLQNAITAVAHRVAQVEADQAKLAKMTATASGKRGGSAGGKRVAQYRLSTRATEQQRSKLKSKN